MYFKVFKELELNGSVSPSVTAALIFTFPWATAAHARPEMSHLYQPKTWTCNVRRTSALNNIRHFIIYLPCIGFFKFKDNLASFGFFCSQLIELFPPFLVVFQSSRLWYACAWQCVCVCERPTTRRRTGGIEARRKTERDRNKANKSKPSLFCLLPSLLANVVSHNRRV